MNQKYKLTAEKLKEYENELHHLTEVVRVQNIIALQEARAQGDLSENADYDAARDEQAKIAGRIKEIENILKNYELISDQDLISDQEDSNLGKWVKIEFIGLDDADAIQCFRIVGTLEADPRRRLISDECPLGKAIINKKVNDNVYVKPEEGEEFYAKILAIGLNEKDVM